MSRNALVTGAAQGIGCAIALRLARDGLNVAVNDTKSNSTNLNDTQKAIEKLGRKSLSITADVSDEKAVVTMIQNAAKELGSLDVMVANAGICETKLMLEISADDWDKILAINLRGIFLCYREAAKVMITQGKGGKTLDACSMIAYKPWPMVSHYSASKWGVRALTQAAAIELAQHQITVNAYCPGMVQTVIYDSFVEKIIKRDNIQKQKVDENFKRAIPLGRLGKPEDVAQLVSYLASEDSDYMTGQSVLIGGGLVFS